MSGDVDTLTATIDAVLGALMNFRDSSGQDQHAKEVLRFFVGTDDPKSAHDFVRKLKAQRLRKMMAASRPMPRMNQRRRT
jgi:hypothetical protein